MQAWGEIRRLYFSEGMSRRDIAQRLGVAWATVDKGFEDEEAQYTTS